MPQPSFDGLSERLLRAGIAPRHVHRYVRELSDHFNDLMREEIAGGTTRDLAETRSLARLGRDDDLANAMLSRPELRSLIWRYPWAVFGLGPIVMLAVSIVAAAVIEGWLLNLASYLMDTMGIEPSLALARRAMRVFAAYNALAVYGVPLAFAAMFSRLGSRQRMPMAWITTGVAIACILGGFQHLSFYDTGVRHGGELSLGSGLFPPFSHFAEDLARAAMNLAIAGGVWWLLSARRKRSPAPA